jgi:hypothetical protein
MLAYLNSLNRNRRKDDPDDPILHEAARIAAWECMKTTFRPGQLGSKSVIRKALIEAGLVEPLLERLETIGILRTNEPAKTHVRFELDPLSEYLAALQLLRILGQESMAWHAFFEEADKKPGAPESIRGFLLAVWDCSEAHPPDAAIPEFVATELTARLALDVASVNRRRRRLSN